MSRSWSASASADLSPASFVVPFLQALFGGGKTTDVVFRTAVGIIAIAFVLSVAATLRVFAGDLGLDQGLPVLRNLLENFPFPFVLVSAFTALNGMFFYLMQAPTRSAARSWISSRASGSISKLPKPTALTCRRPEITAERFEALLPYAVALDVEKPWAHAFEAALRRAHPEDADPMRHYQPAWSSGGGWSTAAISAARSRPASPASAAPSPAPCRCRPAHPASPAAVAAPGGGGGGGGGGGW